MSAPYSDKTSTGHRENTTTQLSAAASRFTTKPLGKSSRKQRGTLQYWLLFLMQCCILWKSMFDFGLPLRGAITTGPYLVRDTCFAGRSILEAHQLATDLNCAGVAIAASAIEWCKAETPEHGFSSNVFHFNYLFPSKAKGFDEHAALNVTGGVSQENQEKWAGDIRQLVHESFWAHNKGAGRGVPQKIENTERLLRFLKMKSPGGFR